MGKIVYRNTCGYFLQFSTPIISGIFFLFTLTMGNTQEPLDDRSDIEKNKKTTIATAKVKREIIWFEKIDHKLKNDSAAVKEREIMYDKSGSITEERILLHYWDTPIDSIFYDYDWLDNLIGERDYIKGKLVLEKKFEYDKLNRLVYQMNYSPTGEFGEVWFSYNPAGKITERLDKYFYSRGLDSERFVYHYDDENKLKEEDHIMGKDTVLRTFYLHDSKKKSVQITYSNIKGITSTSTCLYDSLDRATGRSKRDSVNLIFSDEIFIYNQKGCLSEKVTKDQNFFSRITYSYTDDGLIYEQTLRLFNSENDSSGLISKETHRHVYEYYR